jgi:hypothetical protein
MSDHPIHLRTRANKREWLSDRLWVRKLGLRDRLVLVREGAKRDVLPHTPVWHRKRVVA